MWLKVKKGDTAFLETKLIDLKKNEILSESVVSSPLKATTFQRISIYKLSKFENLAPPGSGTNKPNLHLWWGEWSIFHSKIIKVFIIWTTEYIIPLS